MRKALTLLVAALGTACTTHDDSVVSRLAMDHGLKPGTRLEPTPVECLHGPSRTIGSAGETQIVTFATPFDCSACTPHLAGVPKVERQQGLLGHALLVVWSPNLRTLARDLGAARLELPVCVNRSGSLWDRYNFQHTPFTAVIRNGRVIYMHDGTLLTRRSETEMAADLQKAFRQ
jgi:hypothetical protein